jgi:carboxylesterase type B
VNAVTHGAEIAYVHGSVDPSDSAGQTFSNVVMDYWISFTVSLDPNDGRGSEREYCVCLNLASSKCDPSRTHLASLH